jgi:hypothetical protein
MANGAEPASDVGGYNGGGAADTDDIRSSLAAALEKSRESKETSTPEERTVVPASTPESEIGQPVERDRPATPPDQSDREDTQSETKSPLREAADGRQRDEHGRFVETKSPASSEAASPPVEADGQAAEKSASPTVGAPELRLAPPPGWSPTSKAEFSKLPPSVQADVAKRETEINAGLSQLRDYRRLQQELEPVAQFANANGATLRQVFDRYRQAENNLVNQPIPTLLAFCEHAGVHPAQLLQAVQGGQQQQYDPQQASQVPQGYPANQGHPALGQPQYQPQYYAAPQQPQQPALTAEQVREITLRTQQEAQMANEVERFFGNTDAYPFAQNVRSAMSVLIKSGQADSLEDAYEKAAWAHPETRGLLIKQQREAEEARRAAEAREAASRARQASKSVSGSPLPGGASAAPPKADLDIHEHLAANLRALRSSV